MINIIVLFKILLLIVLFGVVSKWYVVNNVVLVELILLLCMVYWSYIDVGKFLISDLVFFLEVICGLVKVWVLLVRVFNEWIWFVVLIIV